MARNLYNEYYESIYEKAEKMALELLNSKKLVNLSWTSNLVAWINYSLLFNFQFNW